MKIAVKKMVTWGVELWDRFSSRERIYVVSGAVLTTALLGYQFLVSPLMARLGVLDRLILQKEKEVVDMNQLRQQYLASKQKISMVEGRIIQNKGFSLLSFVEEIAVKNQVKDRIVFIRPQPSQVLGEYREMSVEMRLESVTLTQAVKFLETLQNAPQFLRVKRAQLKTRYNDPKLLDGTFVVASYEKTP